MRLSTVQEVRFYGGWHDEIRFRVGEGRSAWDVRLTRARQGSLGVAFVVSRTRPSQSIARLAELAASVSTDELTVVVKPNNLRVRVVMRGPLVVHHIRAINRAMRDGRRLWSSNWFTPEAGWMASDAAMSVRDGAVTDALNVFNPIVARIMDA